MTNMIVCSIQFLLPNTANRFLTPTGSSAAVETVFMPFTACTLKKFRVYVATQGAGVVDHTLTLRKNGVDTALTLKILAADAKPKLYTVSADVAVAEDDFIDVRSVPDAAGASTYTVQWSIDFL